MTVSVFLFIFLFFYQDSGTHTVVPLNTPLRVLHFDTSVVIRWYHVLTQHITHLQW